MASLPYKRGRACYSDFTLSAENKGPFSPECLSHNVCTVEEQHLFTAHVTQHHAFLHFPYTPSRHIGKLEVDECVKRA